MSVTLNDIAAKAGCSSATVSRAMNGVAGVNPELRARILDVVHEMENNSDSDEKSPRRGRPRGSVTLSDTVDVILFRNEGVEPVSYSGNALTISAREEDFPGELYLPNFRFVTDFYRNTIAGIVEFLSKHGMQIMQRFCRDITDNRFVGRINKSKHRGVLLLGSPDKSELDFIEYCALPIVMVDILGVPGVPVVAVDNLGGIEQSLDHLLSLGHRRIAFAGNDTNPSLRIRFNSFCGGMTRAGLSIDMDSCLIEACTMKQMVGRYTEILRSAHRPSAVVCATDFIAISVLKAAQDIGLSVPRDLSIVGFDNTEISSLISPGITTVHSPTFEMGECAANLLMQITEDPSSGAIWNNSEVRCKTRLVVRESTCPPASGF